MHQVILLSDCLCYSNSAMNPVLYAFLSDNFKKSFLKACRLLLLLVTLMASVWLMVLVL